jgi:hypothetical protein
MNWLTPEILAFLQQGVSQMRQGEVCTCRQMYGSSWKHFTNAQKQAIGRVVFRSGEYMRLGLTVASYCKNGSAQTYRLA